MVDLLEAQAQEIKALQRALRALEGRLEVLVQLDAMVAEQLRDPLGGIERRLDGLRSSDGPDWEQAVDQTLDEVRLLSGVVGELTAPQTVEPVAVERSRLVTVPLDGLVEQALSVVSATLDRGRVDVELPPGLMITTAPRRLVGILVSLFENAAACDPAGTIECRAEEREGGLFVEVADRGPGLDDIDLEAIFEPSDDRCGGARASGMYLVRMLARSLGGEATVVERPGGGAVSRVQLPQRRDAD